MLTAKEYARIVAKNLKRIMYDAGKSQADISRDLGINKTTVSSWCRGKATPRMKHIDMLCQYLGCTRSDIMEDPEHPTVIPDRHIDRVLSADEYALFRIYQRLNDTGKRKALDYLADLAENRKYIADMEKSSISGTA